MDRATDAYLAGQPKTKPARQKEAAQYSAATWLAELSQYLDDGQTITPRSKKAVTERLVQFIHNPAIGKHALKTSVAYLQTAPDQQAFFQDAVAACLSRSVFPVVGPLCQMATLLIKADNSFAPKACQGLGRILSVSLPTAYQTENKKYRIEAASTLLQCAPELAEAFSFAALSTLGKRRTQPSFSPIRTLELHLPEITERAPVCIPFIARHLVDLLEGNHAEKAEDAERLIHKMALSGPKCAATIGELLTEKNTPIRTAFLPRVLAALLQATHQPNCQAALENQFLGFMAHLETQDGMSALEALPLFLKQAPDRFNEVFPQLQQALRHETPEISQAAQKAIARLTLEAPRLVDVCALALMDSITKGAVPSHKASELEALKGLLKSSPKQSKPVSDGLGRVMDHAAQDEAPEVQAAACRLMTVRHVPYTVRHARLAVHHLSRLITSSHKTVSVAALEALPSVCLAFKKAAHVPLLHDLLQPTITYVPHHGPIEPVVRNALNALTAIFTPLADKPKPKPSPSPSEDQGRRLHILDLLR